MCDFLLRYTLPVYPGASPDGVETSRAPAQPHPGRVEPLAPARYKIQFTASAELHDKLERRRALTRSTVPDGVQGTESPKRRPSTRREALTPQH